MHICILIIKLSENNLMCQKTIYSRLLIYYNSICKENKDSKSSQNVHKSKSQYTREYLDWLRE